MLVVRAVVGACVIAFVPVLARTLGPTVAGMVMLIPVVTVLSLVFVGQDQGSEAVSKVAVGGLVGLLPLACFLAVIGLLVKPAGVPVALLAGSAVWIGLIALLHLWQTSLARASVGGVAAVLLVGVRRKHARAEQAHGPRP